MNFLWFIMTPRTCWCFPLPSENLADMLYRGVLLAWFCPPLASKQPSPPHSPSPSHTFNAHKNMLPRIICCLGYCFCEHCMWGVARCCGGCPWGRPPLPLGGGGQHHERCCLRKGMTSDEQIARAFVGFRLAGAWVRCEDVVMSDRGWRGFGRAECLGIHLRKLVRCWLNTIPGQMS